MERRAGILEIMEVVKNKKTKRIGLVITIFLLAILWQLFITGGIDFFWEDFDCFHIYWDEPTQMQHFVNTFASEAAHPSKASIAIGMAHTYLKALFSFQRLFQVGFNAYSFDDRPYQLLTWDVFKFLFNTSAFLYRIAKSFFFALNCCLIFLLIKRISRLAAICGVLFYSFSAEIWLSSVYISHLGLISQSGSLLSVFLFIKMTDVEPLRFKRASLFYVPILLASNHAVLNIGDGRYLAVVLFLTILFYRPKQILVHLPFLFVLLIMETAGFWFFKKYFFRKFSSFN